MGNSLHDIDILLRRKFPKLTPGISCCISIFIYFFLEMFHVALLGACLYLGIHFAALLVRWF